MFYYLASNEVDRPTGARTTGSSAALIHVPASAQQAPGALHSCPVCGQCYTKACLLTSPSQIGPRRDERQVLLCAGCGTYSVGLLTDERSLPAPF